MRPLLSLVLITAVLALGEGPVAGQQPPKLPRIGVLSQGTASELRRQRDREAFLQELQKLGYLEGKTIVIEYEYGRRRALFYLWNRRRGSSLLSTSRRLGKLE